MNLYITKKLSDKLKTSPPEMPVEDEFLTWQKHQPKKDRAAKHEHAVCLVGAQGSYH